MEKSIWCFRLSVEAHILSVEASIYVSQSVDVVDGDDRNVM